MSMTPLPVQSASSKVVDPSDPLVHPIVVSHPLTGVQQEATGLCNRVQVVHLTDESSSHGRVELSHAGRD